MPADGTRDRMHDTMRDTKRETTHDVPHDAPRVAPPTSPPAGSVAERNVRTVKQMEADARAERTAGQRFVDALTAIVSDVRFWLAHAAVLVVWIVVNGIGLPGVPRIDPWPFEGLRTVLSLEAIMISCTVLLIQGRMRQNTTRQQHLNLQIDLLAEVEATKSLEMLRALCVHHGLAIAHDAEIEQLVRRLAPEALADEVQEHLVAP